MEKWIKENEKLKSTTADRHLADTNSEALKHDDENFKKSISDKCWHKTKWDEASQRNIVKHVSRNKQKIFNDLTLFGLTVSTKISKQDTQVVLARVVRYGMVPWSVFLRFGFVAVSIDCTVDMYNVLFLPSAIVTRPGDLSWLSHIITIIIIIIISSSVPQRYTTTHWLHRLRRLDSVHRRRDTHQVACKSGDTH